MTAEPPKEIVIAKAIIRYINSLDHAYAHKVHGGPYSGAVGQPDVDACVRGRAVKIEVKRPAPYGSKLTANQAKSLATWERAGALAFVATSVADVRDVLTERGLVDGKSEAGRASP